MIARDGKDFDEPYFCRSWRVSKNLDTSKYLPNSDFRGQCDRSLDPCTTLA
jgi:hypothetical protein